MSNGIFSGLEGMGFGDLKEEDIYKDNIERQKKKEAEKKPEFHEEDMLFDKSHECPVCHSSFKERTLRTGKARMLRTDMDLRTKFEGIEPLKYDVIMCPKCGYTAVSRYFNSLAGPQKKMIIERITSNFKPREEYHVTFSYEEAINRYKLALANAIVKMAKYSEKAYICLRAGWLVRSYSESLQEEASIDYAKVQNMEELEKEFLKNAYEGFLSARQSEGYPMCGMDETTVDYLIAALAILFEHYDVASRIISDLLVSPSCNNRMKDKVRDLKEEMVKKVRSEQEHE